LLFNKEAITKKIRPLNFSIVEETVKTGETFEEAAIRGVKEELGLEVQELKEIGIIHIQDKEYNDNSLNFSLAINIDSHTLVLYIIGNIDDIIKHDIPISYLEFI